MDELAKRFAELAAQYGPGVANAALAATRVEAYSWLAQSVVWLAVSGAFTLAGRYMWRHGYSKDCDDPTIVFMTSSVLFTFALFILLMSVWTWLDPWTWTAIFHPEVYLAKQAFKL